MAGIYIHIPFCKKKCHYCDFYITTNKNNVGKLIEAIKFELILRKNFLNKNKIKTIYFGGGTPSMINPNYIEKIINQIKNNFSINSKVEISIEANPEDISHNNLIKWKKYGINRISLGVQTLNDKILKLINRNHNKSTTISSIKKIAEHFDNFSIDLIYGIPGNKFDKLENDINEIIKLSPPHISAYNLTIEKNTVFHNWLKNNIIKKEKEEEIIRQFNLLKKMLEKEKYIQYETSSFSQKGYESKHNIGYWKRKKYLGIGPSAHSFNGEYRYWNISDNKKYISSLKKKIMPITEEKLSKKMKINEIIMIGIRTKWGIDNNQLIKQLKYDILKNQKQIIEKLIDDKLIYINKTKIKATKKGVIFPDYIAEKLLVGF
tara:strand:+ start:52 stop:1179 length:1128 start_codon:yes stop_codon:yes gene_type:complete